MASIEFGITWWGKAWLDALHKIDYTKKLLNGIEYASNGSVISVEINNNIINAKVQDEDRMTPYQITLEFPKFDEFDQDEIANIIESNHYYISKLESKILPADLLDEMEEEMISLFPKSFRDILMKCDCKKIAQPCKHVAAIFFVIANEIDKNPFIIFSLHGFNILNIIKPQDSCIDETTNIPSIDSFLTGNEINLSKKTVLSIVDTQKLQNIDFSQIPDMQKNIDKLLTDKPLFYPLGDFKKHMTTYYDTMKRKITSYIKKSEYSETPDNQFQFFDLKIKNSSFDFNGKLIGRDSDLKFNLDNMSQFVNYLQNHTLTNVSKHSLEINYISQIYSFVLKLIQQCAYIPEIFSNGIDEYMIRWIPAIFDKQTNQIFTTLYENIPSNIVRYGKKEMAKKDQVYFLISFLISHFQKTFDILPKRGDVQMLSLFFNFDVYTQIKFEDQQIPQTIHLWLSRFYITTRDCSPVIKIDESSRHGDRVFFEILIDDKNRNTIGPISFNKFMATDHPEKNRILKDLSLLSTYLPQVNNFLQMEKRDKRITILSNEFVEVWFDALPILQTLGIKTIMPKSLKKVFTPSLTLNFEMNSNFDSTSKSYLNLESMLNFSWSIALGNNHLTADEFKKLLKKYSGIVRLKDSYVYIDEKEANKILKQLEKKPKLSKIDIMRINLEKKFEGIEINSDNNVDLLFNNMFSAYNPDIPKKLNATLRPYQIAGFKWLYNNTKSGLGSLIADDMGLGKTLQVITLLLKLKEEGILGVKKTLVIVPATLLSNWEHEINKFAPSLKILIYHGQRRKFKIYKFDIIITTYSLVRSELKTFQNEHWYIVITDETQNIKNPTSSQTKAVKSVMADTKIAMTGTPVENRLLDYWSILDFVMKKLLGNRSFFKENFATPIERFRNQVKLDDFRRITAPFILRREKTDKSIINDLPDKIEIEEYNTLTHKQTALYQEIIDNIEAQIQESNGIDRKGLIFKLFTSLKQVCNHPAHYLKSDHIEITDSGKSILLISLLEEIFNADEKVLIFTQYKQMGDILTKMLKKQFGKKPLFLHGGLSRKKRDSIINQFQNEADVQTLILSLKAGGTGLNLTAANNVVHYDLWWNPAVENQATDRAFRIGQKKNVTVFRMITQGTFEEKINEMLKSKKELADLTINVGEKWITEMTDAELKELIKLGQE